MAELEQTLASKGLKPLVMCNFIEKRYNTQNCTDTQN